MLRARVGLFISIYVLCVCVCLCVTESFTFSKGVKPMKTFSSVPRLLEALSHRHIHPSFTAIVHAQMKTYNILALKSVFLEAQVHVCQTRSCQMFHMNAEVGTVVLLLAQWPH